MLNTEDTPMTHAPVLGFVLFMAINTPATALAKPLIKMIIPVRYVKKNSIALSSVPYNFPCSLCSV